MFQPFTIEHRSTDPNWEKTPWSSGLRELLEYLDDRYPARYGSKIWNTTQLRIRYTEEAWPPGNDPYSRPSYHLHAIQIDGKPRNIERLAKILKVKPKF